MEPEKETPKRTKPEPESKQKAEPEPKKKPEPESKPNTEPEPETPQDSDTDSPPIPTVVQLREVASKKERADVKALLDKYGYASISGVPEGKRAALIDELNQLKDKES
ncbi:hypothetical protein LJK88_20300 [Paenibacillus sp. P26]|nr:hypothetical protein LJK88_20300 [Paenibacillus sp. P26]